VFFGLKRVDDGLVLGVIMKQISQRKQGMFAQVWVPLSAPPK
jgi:hypothetical protein